MSPQSNQTPESSTSQPILAPAPTARGNIAIVADPVPPLPEHTHTLPAAPKLDRFHESTEVTFWVEVIPLRILAVSIEATQLRGCARIDASSPRRSYLRLRTLGFKICQYELGPRWEILGVGGSGGGNGSGNATTGDFPPVEEEERNFHAEAEAETLVTRNDSALGGSDIQLSTSLNGSYRSGRSSVDLESLAGARARAGAGISSPGSGNNQGEDGRGRRHKKRPYVVVGVFSRTTGGPDERLLEISGPAKLFRAIWRASVAIRGNGMLFSLRDIKGFGIYQCHPKVPLHERIKVDPRSERALLEFYHAYNSWDCPEEVQVEWSTWLSQLNNNNTNPLEGDMLSLEIILGWSIPRISIVVLTPVLLSLGIGLWLNSKNWGDATTIQTAWSVASYIATAGAFLGALLAIISSINDK